MWTRIVIAAGWPALAPLESLEEPAEHGTGKREQCLYCGMKRAKQLPAAERREQASSNVVSTARVARSRTAMGGPRSTTRRQIEMDIGDAQRENRTRFVGGFYGQLVSGVLWLVSASLATWSTPRAAITMLVVGGFFIFPATELLIRAGGGRSPLSPQNTLWHLGMQVAFVLPFSMPLLLPVGLYRLNWFYPALMVLLGAHYIPFVFLYGMRMFAVLAGLVVGGGLLIAMYGSSSFSLGAWYTGAILVLFAVVGRWTVRREARAGAAQ
ncbi:MAG: hypothetical protein LAO21_21410 [Acidobacteriia bacterium]|nr:hypothetical protein [Terriglobia bacterium]